MPEFKTVERARDKSWCTCQMLPSCKTDPEVGKCISIYLKLDGKTSVILQANHTVVQKKLQTSNIFWIYIYIHSGSHQNFKDLRRSLQAVLPRNSVPFAWIGGLPASPFS